VRAGEWRAARGGGQEEGKSEDGGDEERESGVGRKTADYALKLSMSPRDSSDED